MATKSSTKDEATEAAAEATPSGILPPMEVEDDFNLPLRGKGYNSEVMTVRDELVKCMDEGTIRSFQNVDKEGKEKFARLIRKAGELAEIKTATRHDKNTNKLYWGPEEVMRKLSKAS